MISKPIAKLIKIQIKEKLTDKEMAVRLGCSRQLWQMTRTGKTSLSNTLIKCIYKRFPKLKRDVENFLNHDGDRLSREGDRNPLKQPSQPQGKGLKKLCMGLVARIRERLFS